MATKYTCRSGLGVGVGVEVSEVGLGLRWGWGWGWGQGALEVVDLRGVEDVVHGREVDLQGMGGERRG